MRRTIQYILACVLFFGTIHFAGAQTKPAFWDDIQTIKQYDKLFRPLSSPILFTGSSSIRIWDNMAEMFKDHRVLNRGIGGSVLKDIDRYVEDIIVPYKPKQLILYIGENDIPVAPNGDSVFAGFQRLYQHIRNFLPEVPIAYISIKPSPSREKFMPIAVRANQLIRDFLKQEVNTSFIDIYPLMLDKKGHPRTELFREDMLHMKPAGYEIWAKKIKPYLLK
jgi:lysophospholipase L1-like esterase